MILIPPKTLLAIVLSATLPLGGQTHPRKETAKSKAAITASNFRWTTFNNGSAELSYSLRNNTDSDVRKVKYRVIFYARTGDPVHYEDPSPVLRIPAHLAVTETVNFLEGGLNIYHSTAKLRIDVLSYENVLSESESATK